MAHTSRPIGSSNGADASSAKYAVKALAILAAAQAVCWIAMPILTNDAPPLDVVENAVWGAEHIIASYKNPALSSMLLEAARMLTGAVGWPAYVLSQIAVCTTFIFVFLLGRDELGDARAFVGSALLTGCYYFGWHTPEFNQDIVEMPFWAGIQLALWKATETSRTSWWVALGAFAAAALYGKLSAAVILLAAGGWLLFDSRARKSLASPGPWLALAVFGVLVSPLAVWLWNGGLHTITEYAVQRGRTKFSAVHFIGLQVLLVVPMIVMLWICCLLRTGGARRVDIEGGESRFIIYLLWMTVAPILVTAVAVTAAKTGTKIMWGVPMLNLTGLLIVAIAGASVSAYTATALNRVLAVGVLAIIATSTAVGMTTRFGNQFRPIADRQNWPQTEIAQRFKSIFANETGRPLRVVASDRTNWIAGLIALDDLDDIKVYTEADTKLSPWITPELVAASGVLVAWEGREQTMLPELKALAGNRTIRYETFALRHPGKVRDVTISYVIVPPQKPQSPQQSTP